MASQQDNRATAQDYAFWRGDLLPAWVFFIEYAIIVGCTAVAMILPYGFVSWVLLVAVYIVAWAIAVIVMIPRTAPKPRELAEIRRRRSESRTGEEQQRRGR